MFALTVQPPPRNMKTKTWQELLKAPDNTDHIVQVYQDTAFLIEAVAAYVVAGFQRGEAAIVITRPAHSVLLEKGLRSAGFSIETLLADGQLTLFDAAETLTGFMKDGMPVWSDFRNLLGGIIAELRLRYPGVRAYGEMVDILWQEGQRDAAIKLEQFWNELIAMQTFSLFCSYRMDNTAPASYSGPLQRVCRVHSHLIPARNYDAFNKSVIEASEAVLGKPLVRALRNVSGRAAPPADMPEGQAQLLWLRDWMPSTADKVLAKLRAEYATPTATTQGRSDASSTS